MTKAKQLGYVLSLIAIATATGHPRETASEYVAPEQAVPRGKAPKMQVELLNPGEPTKQYAVIFHQGDEVFSGSRGANCITTRCTPPIDPMRAYAGIRQARRKEPSGNSC